MRDNKQRGFLGTLLITLMVAGPAAAAGDSQLISAARNQDRQAIRSLLKQRVDVNARADDGSTALLWAAHWNDLEMAGLLIGAGADANAANAFLVTPLSEACLNGSAPLVDRLLRAGANPNAPVGTGETPLMTCAATGSVDAVKALLVRGADVNAKEPKQNQTALMWAVAERHADVASVLLEANADPLAPTKNGFTPLHFAAREGDMESVKILLAAGVNINVHSMADVPKQKQLSEADLRTVAAGSARGADVAARTNRSTPLLVATIRGQVPLALFLLDQGAEPDAGEAGMTPLHWAVGTWENPISNPIYGFSDAMSGIPDRQQKTQLIRALLAHGANPNARMTSKPPVAGGEGVGGFSDVIGATPFIIASNAADLETMKILLEGGAEPKLVTESNSNALLAATALHRGVGENAVEEEQALGVVKFLLELGVDPKVVTTFRENALFGPAYRGWNTMLELLIEKGADVNVVSKAGVTPWLAASGFGDRLGGVLFNTEGAAILEKHGADPKLGRPCQAQNRCREIEVDGDAKK